MTPLKDIVFVNKHPPVTETEYYLFSRRGYSETIAIVLFSNCRLIFTLLFQRCSFCIHVFGLSIFQLFSYIGIYIYFTIDTVLFYFFVYFIPCSPKVHLQITVNKPSPHSPHQDMDRRRWPGMDHLPPGGYGPPPPGGYGSPPPGGYGYGGK